MSSTWILELVLWVPFAIWALVWTGDSASHVLAREAHRGRPYALVISVSGRS